MLVKSNFRDYWMPYVSNTGRVLELYTNKGPSKREQFAILERKFSVPPHGLVHEIWNKAKWDDGRLVEDIVIYTDETKHCGEGKDLIIKKDIPYGHGLPIWMFFKYCSGYVPQKGSVRKLQIGNHVFWIEYKSDDPWRSNVGNVECQVVGRENGKPDLDLFPFYTIDFVCSNELISVDLNVAPGIRGSGVENHLTGKEVADILESYEIQKE